VSQLVSLQYVLFWSTLPPHACMRHGHLVTTSLACASAPQVKSHGQPMHGCSRECCIMQHTP
jgi:hypothetical protein